MNKCKRNKPKRANYNYGDVVVFKNLQDDLYVNMKVNHIKRYGKSAFMYSQNGSFWVSEYRCLPF